MRYLLPLLLLISAQGFAQCKEYIIGVSGDTLNCRDAKGRQQGPWIIKTENIRGERGYEEQGYFENGQRTGKWQRFSLEGDLLAIENYRWGNKHGKSVYFSNMGDPLREESWRAVDPSNPYDTVNVYDINDPTKVVGRQVVKLEGTTLKHGTWTFYDPLSGRVEKTESWYLDRPAKKTGDGEDDLLPIDVATHDADGEKAAEKKVAKPKEVLEFEKKNAGKKKIKVRTGSTGG